MSFGIRRKARAFKVLWRASRLGTSNIGSSVEDSAPEQRSVAQIRALSENSG